MQPYTVMVYYARAAPSRAFWVSVRYNKGPLFVMNQFSSKSPVVFLGESRKLESIEAVVTLDKDWCYTHVNVTAERLLGMARDQLLNRRIWDVFPETSGTQIETVLRRAMSEREPFEFEGFNRLRDKWYANKVVPGPKGSISICFRDVTERKRTQEAKARLAAIVESSDDAIIAKDLDGIISTWNRGAEKIFGYTAEEAIGQPVTMLIPEGRRDEESVILDRIRSGEKIDHYETVRQRKDGTLLDVSLTVSPLRDAGGNIVGASKIARDITQRKKAEEAQARLAAIVATSDDAIISKDLNGVITSWNRGAEQIYGYTPEEAIGKPVTMLIPQERLDEEPRILERIRRGEKINHYETVRRRKDGTFLNISLTVSPLRDARGNIVGASKVARDITQRKQAEEAQSRLAAIVATSDDAIISKDLNGIINSWNRGAEQIFGYTPEEAIGKPVTMLIPEERLDEEPGILERIRRGEKIDHYETIRRHKDGTLLNISLSVSPITDANGKVIGASKISRDITARKRQEERLRLLWETAAIMLSTDNPGAMVQDLFDKVHQHLGADTYFNYMINSAGDALQLISCAGIPDETARSIERVEFGEDICGTVALQRRPIVATHIQQSGEPRLQLVKSFGIRAYACNPLIAENRLIGTLSFASHTKDQFDAEEIAFFQTLCHYVTISYERLQLVERLRETDRRKDEFLATLAHELRNPLAPVRNSLQLLRLANGNSGLIDQSCNILERQVAQMVRLVDDLLDVARITRGKLDLRREPVELAAVVRNSVEISGPFIEQMGHKLTVNLPQEAVPLHADPLRISQIFSNLLNNAAKYTKPGGHIWLTAECQGSDAVVTVRDTGIGIPADKLPRIFDELMQVDRSQERTQGGLGIGLTLVKRLTEMHGGSVEARSGGPDKGSEFMVRLPVAAISGVPDELNTETAKPFGRRRILIVDDNRDGADSLARILKLLGNRVQTAYDGIDAVQAAEGFHPDVVLLDIGLPKMDGHKVCRYIREQPWGQNMVLIAVTGWGQDEDKRRSLEAGFNFHLVKPIDPSELGKLLVDLENSRSKKL